MRDGVEVIYQAAFATAAGAGAPTSSSCSPTARYEALDTKLARHAKPALHPPALLLLRAGRAHSGARARADARRARLRRARAFRPEEFDAYYRRVRGAARAVRRRPAADRAVARRRTATSATSAALRGQLGRGRPPLARRRHPRAPDREARRRRHRDARRARRAPARAAAAGFPPRRFDEAPPAGRAPALRRASTAHDAYELLAPQPSAASRSCPSPPRATSSSTSRATRSGTRAAALEYLFGILDVDGSVHAALGARPRRASARAFEQFVDLVHERLARHPDLHVYHYAPYETPRSGGSWAATARARRRSTTCCAAGSSSTSHGRAQRHPRLAARLLAQEGRGVPRLRARAPRSRRRRLDRRLRAVDRRRATTRCSSRSTTTTRGLPRDAARCATGCSSCAPRRSRSSGRCRRRASRRSRRADRAKRRARGAARRAARRGRGRSPAHLLDYHRREAQAGLVGVLRPARDDARRARRGRRVDRPARARRRAGAGRAVARVHVRVPAAGAQARPGPGRRRPGDGQGAGEIIELDRERAARSCSSAGRRSTTCRCRPR